MEPLDNAPGVLRKASRPFVTQEDVSKLLGCSRNKAYETLREVNKCAKSKGKHPFPAGKANKYLFADIYGIPLEDVDRVINSE